MKNKPRPAYADKATQTEPLTPPRTPSPTPAYPSRAARDEARAARKLARRQRANASAPGTYVWCRVCRFEVRAAGHETRCGRSQFRSK